jgi:hypothetical protein
LHGMFSRKSCCEECAPACNTCDTCDTCCDGKVAGWWGNRVRKHKQDDCG